MVNYYLDKKFKFIKDKLGYYELKEVKKNIDLSQKALNHLGLNDEYDFQIVSNHNIAHYLTPYLFPLLLPPNRNELVYFATVEGVRVLIRPKMSDNFIYLIYKGKIYKKYKLKIRKI